MTTNGHLAVSNIPLWRDNQPLPIDHARLQPVTSSTTGKNVFQYHSATVDDAEEACHSARAAFKTWKHSTVAQRRQILNKWADILVRDAERFRGLQNVETSAGPLWTQNNIDVTVGYVREIAAEIGLNSAGTIPAIDRPDTTAFVFREPVGTILIIPPWNGAMVLAGRAMAMAIATGCTTVMKASELCPATHHAMVEALAEAGLPAGVLNKVQVARADAAQVTEALIAHPAIRKVDFIGSAAVGRIIGATAAKHLKPVLMELGGKSPAIVLDDADLEQAADLCAKGALIHHGQICFSTERIIVHEKVASRFKELLVKAIDDNAQVAGSAVSHGIAAHAHEVLEDAQANGLEFLTGGPEFLDGDNRISLKPSIIMEPKGDARIVDEETFGPSASLYVVASDQAAIDRANDSSYGLNSAIHTTDLARGLRMGRELEYGQVHINNMTILTFPRGPQGGVKGSGWGRENSRWGFDQFTQEKFITWRGK
ncbi:MAG: hypothetical protein Q9162_002181 [Coniocarpon cinnabarinum]